MAANDVMRTRNVGGSTIAVTFYGYTFGRRQFTVVLRGNGKMHEYMTTMGSTDEAVMKDKTPGDCAALVLANEAGLVERFVDGGLNDFRDYPAWVADAFRTGERGDR
jgi:hypothetical protein